MLELATTPSGDAIELPCGRIDRDNMLAYVVELLELVSPLPPDGFIRLQRSDFDGRPVCQDFAASLERLIGTTVETAFPVQPSATPALPAFASVARESDVTESRPAAETSRLVAFTDHRSLFDPRRTLADPPAVAGRGQTVKHCIRFVPQTICQSRPVSLAVDLAENERMLGSDGAAFFQPVLVDAADRDGEPTRLSLMRGDTSGTADLAAALGIDVAVVAPNAASDSHERVILRLRRDRLERFGDSFDGLCVVFFTRVLRGRVDLNGRGSLSPPASLVRRPAGTALRTWRSDPPHRSQSRLPANYAGELKRRYRIA